MDVSYLAHNVVYVVQQSGPHRKEDDGADLDDDNCMQCVPICTDGVFFHRRGEGFE